jgi:hypothetical protein
MKKVTITLDENTAALTRVHAARRNQSVSRFVGQVLRERMLESREYDAAMKRYLSKEPFPLTGPPQRYPKREELYDRPVFRRIPVEIYSDKRIRELDQVEADLKKVLPRRKKTAR